MPRLVFFGTPTYSLIVLNRLYEAGFSILAVVTKPAQPVGRKQKLTESPVAEWAQAHSIRVFRPEVASGKSWQFADAAKLTQDIVNLKPDLLVVADYAQKIPAQLIAKIPAGGLNVHPSLLPAYRGPAPVPWVIINGETETGVSVVTLADEFDQGIVVAQEKEEIQPTDTTHSLLTRLFAKGTQLLVQVLPEYVKQPQMQWQQFNNETIQPSPSYTPRLTRDYGFIPWELIQAAMRGESFSSLIMKQWNNVTIVKTSIESKRNELSKTPVAILLDRAFRAFHPWPGIWSKITINGEEKRLKLLRVHLNQPAILSLDEIQLEGKQPIRGRDVVNFLKQLTL